MRPMQARSLGFAAGSAPSEPVHLEELEHLAAARIELRLFHRRSPIIVAGAVCGGPDVELALSILWLIAVVWLLLRAWRQRGALRSLVPAPFSGLAPSVAVIVPARV